MHYDADLPLKLDTDASFYGIGAVISHILPNSDERPIAFSSRTLSKSERNYSQLEKESLSIIFGIQKFHQYNYIIGIPLAKVHEGEHGHSCFLFYICISQKEKSTKLKFKNEVTSSGSI